jgi:hypothetical protein
VMRSRVDRSDAIVMDLRGFTSDRYGCRIELAYLSCAAPNKPVLLVVDEKTNLDLIKTIVGAPVGTVAAKPDWLVVFASMQQRVRRFGTFRHLAHLIDASELRNHLSLPRILSRPGSAATFLPKLVATVAVRSRRVPQKSSTY